MLDIDTRVRSALSSPRIVWLAALLAVSTSVTALWFGFVVDDRVMLLGLLARLHGVPMPDPWWDSYRVFASGAWLWDATKLGYLPWWTSPRLSIAFLRPLAVITHDFDLLLWPASPAAMHAHNLAWYALLAALVARLYRQLLGACATAGLCALLFAIDDAHAACAAWIAGRNTLLTAVFLVAALASHDRVRRGGARAHRWLGPLFAALAFLSSEGAIALWAFLAAHALFLDRGALRARAAALVPFAAVTALWAGAYALGGYGASGSGHYLDPRSASYAAELGGRLRQNLSDQFLVPQSLLDGLPHGTNALLLWPLATLAVAFALATAICLRDRPVLRYAVTATLLALLPACAAVPTPRLLLVPSIAAAIWLGELCVALLERARAPETRWLRAPALAVAIALLALHGPLSAWHGPESARVLWRFDRAVVRTSRSLLSSASSNRALFVLNTPHYFATRLAAGYRDGRSVPASLFILGASERPVRVTRETQDAITLEPEGGYLREHWSQLTRDPREPFTLGQRIPVAGGSVQVVQLTDDGRAARIRFEMRDLAGPAAIWSAWDPDRAGYVHVELPAVGRQLRLDSRRAVPDPFTL